MTRNTDLISVKGIHFNTEKYIEVIIDNEHIHSVREIKKNENIKQIIAPGLVDIQTNGYKGYDFNQEALNREEWDAVIQFLLEVGVTTFFPTIITNSFEKLHKIFKKNIKILKETNMYNGMVGGFHLEGPYLSPIDGPRGAHKKKFITPPNWEEFCKLQESAEGQIKIITLSPEWDNSASFIEKVTNSGVKVAIGHTAANSKQIRDAINAGATLSTHLGNGAHVTLPRHPNYIWDQLAEENLWASVISDGHHIPDNVLKVFQKVKTNKMILVSDSVALAGYPPGEYTTAVGGEVTLNDNGLLHLRNEPKLLAGSALCLLQGVRHCINSKVASKSEAIKKASIYPATFMNLNEKEGISKGAIADLITIKTEKKEWKVNKVFKKGKQKLLKEDF